jgi:hypothetical protein
LVPGKRAHSHLGELFRQPEPVQDAGRVRADLNPGPNLAELAGLLVHVHVESGAQQ